MSNIFNHTRYRMRHIEFERLTHIDLKKLAALNVNDEKYYTWSNRRKVTLKCRIKRTHDGLFFFLDESQGYRIKFTQTPLTYGDRTWFSCPSCNRRCAVLYNCKYFVCRRCAKPSYESQNGSELNYQAEKIIELREKLWGKSPIHSNLMESCHWFPKPKHIHWKTFERKRAKIMKLEERYNRLLTAQFDLFSITYNTLLD